MKSNLLKAALPLSATLLLLPGCIDDNYDLSNIDSTTTVKINDLVLPVKLASVTLDNIIKIEDDSEDDAIKKVTLNGKEFYAVNKSGEFESDEIEIPGFSVSAPHLEAAHAQFAQMPAQVKKRKRGVSPEDFKVTYTLTAPVEKELAYSASGIDKSIHTIGEITVVDKSFETKDPLTNHKAHLWMDLELNPASTSDLLHSCVLNDVQIQLPAGLEVSAISPSYVTKDAYDQNTGLLSIPQLEVKNGILQLLIFFDGFNFAKANVPEAGSIFDYNHADGVMNFDSHFTLRHATMTMTPLLDGEVPKTLPETIGFDVTYTLSELTATTFSGKVEYSIEGDDLHIDPVDLNDLPDFLAGEQTNIILANPQIYLGINNPVAGDKLNCQTGLKLTANRDGEAPKDFTLDNGFFKIGYEAGNGIQNFVLCPNFAKADIPAEYAGAKDVPFSTLGNVISGHGLPSTIGIELVDPKIPLQPANKFQLDHKLPKIKGSYRFLAPLALKNVDGEAPCQIVYSDTKENWDEDEVKKITIKTLELSASVTNDLPLDAVLTAHPLVYNEAKDVNERAQGVKIESSTIKGNSSDVPVTIVMTVEGDKGFNNLNGITFEAQVTPDDSETPLAPSQTLTLKDIRIKVGGEYTTDF